MDVKASDETVDFNVLADYLKAEMARNSAEERAIHLASEKSFAQWARTALEGIAEKLGIGLGYLVGLASNVYEGVKSGFGQGFAEGLKRGLGE